MKIALLLPLRAAGSLAGLLAGLPRSQTPVWERTCPGSSASSLRRLALLLLSGLAPLSAFAQGNDNPTGVAGAFNGNSATGCSYDPYTSNATRTIPDITVAGAVGGYPLQWSRTMNSRAYGYIFGAGGGWRHSYQWVLADSETFNTFEPGAPGSYGVALPDGRFQSFSYNSTTQTCSPFFPGPTERFLPLNLTTLLAYLVLPDGGMVEFKATKWKYHSPDPPYEDPPATPTRRSGSLIPMACRPPLPTTPPRD